MEGTFHDGIKFGAEFLESEGQMSQELGGHVELR